MRAGWLGIVALIAFGACERPDAERDGFVLVDDEARAAGVAIEVSGEAHEGALPVTVPEGAMASVVRRDGREPITVGPGELVEVVGADGEVRRRAIPRDRIAVGGEPDAVLQFAEMIGARAAREPDGRWLVEGPDAFVLAALLGHVPGITVTAPAPESERDPTELDVPFALRHRSTLGADDGATDASPTEVGPIPDPAALVGAYAHGRVTLLLDAAGGYRIVGADGSSATGRFRVRPGGVDFLPDDGEGVQSMGIVGEQLVDDVGIDFAPVQVTPEPEARPLTLLQLLSGDEE